VIEIKHKEADEFPNIKVEDGNIIILYNED